MIDDHAEHTDKLSAKKIAIRLELYRLLHINVLLKCNRKRLMIFMYTLYCTNGCGIHNSMKIDTHCITLG